MLGYKEDGVFAFYSIPYATAPTGVSKFKAPHPAPAWINTFEAVDKGIICPQADVMNITIGKKQQEDCLIANVYVPDTTETNLTVLVYVHGGAYHIGYGEFFKLTKLMQNKNIITVTFNYRLGVHGFLCLGTNDVPGNAGMKDQVALLRWVKKNIASFGGNPDDVIIQGASAGSSAVDLLQLSKTTMGLFNKVIPESGANVGVWSVQLDPLENAKYLARQLNFDKVDDVYALEEFYKTLPVEKFNSDEFMSRKDSNFLFSPCVEREVSGEERFLEDSPVNILKRGTYNKLPMLYGFAQMEGLFRVNVGIFQQWTDEMNNKFSDFLPVDLQFANEEQKEEVAEKIKTFYFGDKPVGEDTIYAYIDYFTDIAFAYPTLRSVTLQAGNNQIYLYEYSYAEEAVSVLPNVKILGANHCDQSFAVIDGAGMKTRDESILSEDTKKMKALIRKLWLNFITTGVPVPEGSSLPAWPPVGADRGPHMSLDRTLQLRGPLLAARARFWDAIYERHYRQPVPPPHHPPRSHGEL